MKFLFILDITKIYYTNSGTTQLSLFFKITNEPDLGLLYPSAHIFIMAAIPSGFVHLEKSSKGIFFRLSGVSKISLEIIFEIKIYGKIVMIIDSEGKSVLSFKDQERV